MKKIVFIFVALFFIFNCSDSESTSNSDASGDILVLKDIVIQDTEIVDISGSDIVVDDISVIDAVDTIDYGMDILEDITDIELKDEVATDFAVSDLSDEINIDDVQSQDMGNDGDLSLDVIDDVVSDAGTGLNPPVLELLTESPSESTQVYVGGYATGDVIYIYKNKFCTDKPLMSLASTIFNRGGVNIEVAPSITTYFSAYVEDSNGNKSNCSNYLTYVHNDGRFLKVTFFDDFKGQMPDEDPECYSMPPQCIGEYLTELYECPQSEIHKGLESLNKCNWTILRQPNWMAKEYGPDRNGTNGFTPLEVSVDPNLDNGVLILSANPYKWDGTKMGINNLSSDEKNCLNQSQSNWLLHENNSPDCRNIVEYDCVWNKNTLNCPIMAGAVYSKHFKNYKKGSQTILKDRGYINRFGRWEVRAKLSSGTGSWPAHWLLPQSGSWPERGEIDILEADGIADISYQTYHTGYCDGVDNHFNNDNCYSEGGWRYHLSLQGQLRMKNGSFSNDYHTFAVEWDKSSIRFLTDNILTKTISEGDLSYGNFTDYFRYTGKARPVNIPDLDSFIILNQSVRNPYSVELNPMSFISQFHYIDYVKVYNICQTPSDFCNSGYYFDGNDGLCHPIDNSGISRAYRSPCRIKDDLIPQPQPIDTKIYYDCTVPCPFGGWFDGSNCAIFDSPSGREVFFYPENESELPNLYYVTDGSADGNCYDYVNSVKIPVGAYDGANCYLDKTLPELQGKYFRWGNPKPTSFYYQPICKFQ